MLQSPQQLKQNSSNLSIGSIPLRENHELPSSVPPAFVVYHKGVALRLQWSVCSSNDSTPACCSIPPVIQVCSIDTKEVQLLLLLTADYKLYQGILDEANNALDLTFLRSDVIDVAFCRANKQLFVVTVTGIVLHRAVDATTNLADDFNESSQCQLLSFDPLEVMEEGIRIQKVCCSEQGSLFVTNTGDIYAIGECGEVFSVPDLQPKHLRLFGGPNDALGSHEILELVAGNDFFVVLIQKVYDEKTDPLQLCDKKLLAKKAPVVGLALKSQLPPFKNSSFCAAAAHEEEVHHEIASNSSLVSLNCSNSSTEKSSVTSFETNMRMMLQQGHSLLQTQVYTFGSANNGLLGTGDHIKRNTANNIKKLEHQGVCSISAGRLHSLARTIDGRLYHWGSNAQQQLLAQRKDVEDVSSPSEIQMDKSQLSAAQKHILWACCGDYSSVLLNACGQIDQSHHQNGRTFMQSAVTAERDLVRMSMAVGCCKQSNIPLLLNAADYTIHNIRVFQAQYHNCFNSMQQQVKQMVRHETVVEFLIMRQKYSLASLRLLLPLCVGFKKMLSLSLVLLYSLERFYRGDVENPADLYFIKYHRECIELFEKYTSIYCDIYSIDGFTEGARIFSQFASLSQNSAEPVNAGGSLDLARIFAQPFHVYAYYIQFLELLVKKRSEFKEHLQAWLSFGQYHRIEMELAESTQEFWKMNERNNRILPFRRKHRRVILTSMTVALKVASRSISSSTFILFSDCLCQISSQLYTYPLVTMWLGKIDNENYLRIITPERTLDLSTKNILDKKLWYDQLEKSILNALGRPHESKLSSIRRTAYVFSRSHPKYGGVHAYGRWKTGVLDGNCYLEYPDGRFYFGEMRHGEIEGYGKMVIPSVGLYEGHFKAGKFHGYGVYEMQDNEVYEGNFRDGLFHGHGVLRSNNYNYVGEFKDNLRCGYGVLDDIITGDKYMGMFADNKRIGAGTCVTMNGDYFEGSFNNSLMGTGIAIFENDYYYEGELTMQGPNGRGTYYMPTVAAASPMCDFGDESSKQTFIGNVLSGQLGGSWNDVRILVGNIALNRQFSKYPSSIGALVVDNNRKWRSLFENFEQELMDCGRALSFSRKNSVNAAASLNDGCPNATKEVWNRIAVFMCSQRHREKTQEQQQLQQISPTPGSSSHSYFGHNISLNFSNSFDKLSLKSTNSLFTAAKSSTLDLGSNLNLSMDSRQRSQSDEQLMFDESELKDLEFVNACTSFPNAYYCDKQQLQTPQAIRKHSNMNWTRDSTSVCESSRSSFDSVLNATEYLNNNNSFSSQNTLDYVPNFGITSLNEQDFNSIKEYLQQAFQDRHHPLYVLNQRIASCFYISYGCWKVKPTSILTKQAMREWESISKRVYAFVRKMFPALPEDYIVLESASEVVSHITLLYPIVLSEGIYSTLFVLYANKYSQKDKMYRQNIMYAEKLTDEELASVLCPESSLLPVVTHEHFRAAIETLKQLQEKFSPKAMLNVIEKCIRQITEAHKQLKTETAVILSGDSMMPLTLMLALRAALPHLGAELALLDDLTAGANFQFEMNSFAGYCFTTLKAAYEHISACSLNKSS